MPRALPPPPLQLRKERLVEVEDGGTSSSADWRRRMWKVLVTIAAFIVVVAASIGVVGLDHHRALASPPALNDSDLSPSLRDRLADIHHLVSKALKGKPV